MGRAKNGSPKLGSAKRHSESIEYAIVMTLLEVEATDKTVDTQDRSKPKRKSMGRKTGGHSSTKDRSSGTARVKHNKKSEKRPKTSKKKICPKCSGIILDT